MRPGFFLKESFRSIKRNALPSFAALASVLVTTLVLGVFIPVVEATNGAANDVRGRVLVDVDLATSASPAEVARVRGELQRAPHVKSIQYVSKQQGYAQEKKRNPQAFALIGYNPLPDIFRLTPDKPHNSAALRAELDQSSPLGTRLVTDSAIAAVQNRQAQTNQILSATRKRALRDRGLSATSLASGVTTRRVRSRTKFSRPHPQTGSPGGQTHRSASARIRSLTRRSSRE